VAPPDETAASADPAGLDQAPPQPSQAAAAGFAADKEPVTKVQRTVEILRVLQRHNVFDLVRDLAEAERVEGVARTELDVPEDAPERVRQILQDLGPTFIKMGQLLGTRPDLVPKEFCDEFEDLYDQTRPTPFEDVREVVETELGQPLEEVYASFDEEPVASASIGQVHFATLHTGERVAVKVQHPRIEQRMALDFEILEPLVGMIERVFAGSRVWQPEDHLRELRSMLAKELDYSYEARNQQRVVENFQGDPNVKIPKVYWQHSGRRVLTLEYVDGIKLEDLEDGGAPGIDGPRVAERITHSMAEMIFEHRIFHADPSPGNVLILDSDTVAYLDFGAVGHVTRRRAERILGLLVGFRRDDLDMVAQNLVELCNKVGPFEPGPFKKDLERIMEFHERERASPGNPRMLDMIIDVARQHNLRLPPDFMLITRALFQFEGMCRRLDPDYELIDVLGPVIQERLFERYTDPQRLEDAMVDIGIHTAELVKNAPQRLNSILRKLEQDELEVNLDLTGLREHQRHQELNVMRGSLALLASVLLLGVGLLLALGQGDELGRFLLVAVVVLLLWLGGLVLIKEHG
jgi:ubiquinone biosynthesis protein